MFGKSASGAAEISRESVLARAKDLSGKPDTRQLTDHARDIAWGDFIWVYGQGVGGIYALARVADVQCKAKPHTVDLIWDHDATTNLTENPILWSRFGQDYPIRPAWSTNEGTAKALEDWLAQHGIGTAAFEDLEAIESEQDLRKFAWALVAYREGQQDFRNTLLDRYERRCVATGADIEAVLEAAHISRYMGRHSNDPSNGLLLRRDIHRLFDLNLLAFDITGKAVVAPKLAGSEYVDELKDLMLHPKVRQFADLRALRRKMKLVMSNCT